MVPAPGLAIVAAAAVGGRMMRSEAELLEDLSGMVRKYAPPGARLARETELGADLNIDSVAAMDLIMEIEDRFEIDIPVSQVSDLRSLGDLLDLVRARIGGR
jgi:acyl carrier protein